MWYKSMCLFLFINSVIWVFVALSGPLLAAVHRLLIAVASLVAEHRLQACTGFRSCHCPEHAGSSSDGARA